MKIIFSIRKKPLKWLNIALAVGMCVALAKPLANDWVARSFPTPMASRLTATAGFSDLSGFLSSLGGLLSAFKNALNPFVESSVAALEKEDGARKELDQAGFNYEAGTLTADAGQKAQDMVSSETSMACEVIRGTKEAVGAKQQEGMLTRALTAAHGRRGRYTASSSGEMQSLLATSMSDYCSPDSKERGLCSGEISPKNLPDADIQAGTLLSFQDNLTQTMSRDEYEAASKYVSWATDPIPAEQLPITMEKTPAGQRYLLEARRRQAITSSAQYSLNRIIASRWEKK